MTPDLILSGGQSGADMGGLLAAEKLGIPTGGWAPKGYLTEAGPNPELKTRFNLDEHESPDYTPRTEMNVRMSDATVIFGKRSRGSNRTEHFCNRYKKPLMWIQDPLDSQECLKLRLWLVRNKPRVLNVAGNRESNNRGLCGSVEWCLKKVLSV